MLSVEDNTVDGCLYGIKLRDASNVNINDNTVRNSLDVGVYLTHSSDNTISGNTITDNGNGATTQAFLQDAGILIDASQNDSSYGSSNNAVAYNTVTGTKGYGIIVGYQASGNNNNGFHENVIRNSTKTGLWLYRGTGNTVYNNSFESNGGTSLYNVVDAVTGNSWYQAKQAVESNIIGGGFLGGNYYDDYSGTDTD